MSPNARAPVIRVTGQIRLTPVSSATQIIETWHIVTSLLCTPDGK